METLGGARVQGTRVLWFGSRDSGCRRTPYILGFMALDILFRGIGRMSAMGLVRFVT